MEPEDIIEFILILITISVFILTYSTVTAEKKRGNLIARNDKENDLRRLYNEKKMEYSKTTNSSELMEKNTSSDFNDAEQFCHLNNNSNLDLKNIMYEIENLPTDCFLIIDSMAFAFAVYLSLLTFLLGYYYYFNLYSNPNISFRRPV